MTLNADFSVWASQTKPLVFHGFAQFHPRLMHCSELPPSRAQLTVSPVAALSLSLSLSLGLTRPFARLSARPCHWHCILYFSSPVLESSFFAVALAYN
jgi:hypothetical protein